MGDHRANSADSRFHLDEPVQRHRLRGRGRGPGHGHRLAVRPLAQAGGARTRSRRCPTRAPGRPRRSARRIGWPPQDRNGLIPLPTPAELPLVMGVVGLRRIRAQAAARSEEWMWGMWRSAHDPDTTIPRGQRGAARGSGAPAVDGGPASGSDSEDGGRLPTGAAPSGTGAARRSSAPSGRSCRS